MGHMDRLTQSNAHKAIDRLVATKELLEDLDYEFIDVRDYIESIEAIIDRLYSILPN